MNVINFSQGFFEGNIFINDTDWTLHLLRNGFAHIFPEADYDEQYFQAESEAEKEKLGLLY